MKEIVSKVKSISPSQCLLSTFPVIKTLSRYSWSKDLPGDLISGCTVAVMHIPQGIGFTFIYLYFFEGPIYNIYEVKH